MKTQSEKNLVVRMLLLGVVGGVFLAVMPSCGSTNNGAAHCTRSNCAGCCDANGQCQTGDTDTACGTDAVSCISCSSGQVCSSGACRSGSGAGGGDGGTVCNAQTCPSGCCSANNECKSGAQVSACGKGGQVCSACGSGQICSQGACTTDSCGGDGGLGCRSTDGTNACLAGTDDIACGAAGFSCIDCTITGQVCDNGSCVTPNGGSCTAQTCPNGCCQGNTCVDYSGQSSAVCGTGGASCGTCQGGGTCSSGICSGGTGGGSGGGVGGGAGGGAGGGSGFGCDPTNCATGCCYDPFPGSGFTFCFQYADQDDTACGTGGHTCDDCTNNNQVCNGAGACQ